MDILRKNIYDIKECAVERIWLTMNMIIRQDYIKEITTLFETFPIVAILGARQIGKSTLAHQYLKTQNLPYHFYDLESDRDQAILKEAQFALEQHSGLIIIDEIQRYPDLFPLLRYMVDYHDQRYLILGSASRDLIHQSTETLAGRIAYIDLNPISLAESSQPIESHLLKGGFPKSLLSRSEASSYKWREEFIKTFLERDLLQLGFDISPSQMRQFWKILAHYHGQIFNAHEISMNLGVSLKTAQRYLSILEGSFMAYQLRPWHENLQKRQIKRSKTYFNDVGILNSLLGIESMEDFLSHPKLGAIFEGFALQEIIQRNNFDRDDCYFWATSNNAELDLLAFKGTKRFGFEFKFTAMPKITKSMLIACEDLKLDMLTIIIPKGKPYKLSPTIEVFPLEIVPDVQPSYS